MHLVLVRSNRLGGLSLPRYSVVRLTDHPHITKLFIVEVKQQKQQQQQQPIIVKYCTKFQGNVIKPDVVSKRIG